MQQKPATGVVQNCPEGQRQFLVDDESVCTVLVGGTEIAEGEQCPELDNTVVVLSSDPTFCLFYEIIGPAPVGDYSCTEGELSGTNCVIKRGGNR
jgi:hypothetical protein